MTTSSGAAKPKARPKVQVVIERQEGKSRKWLWVTIVIMGLIILTNTYNNRLDRVATPLPATVAAAQGATQSQQQATPVVLAYTNGDYEVGNGAGQIALGRYYSDGDTAMLKFSMWTAYSDSGKQHPIDFGSVNETGRRYMTVTKNMRMVSFVGDAMWIKG